MIILPAIDLVDGKAVRLFKGDYNEMTVYSEDPAAVAKAFEAAGAEYIHLVDLEGARDGGTPNMPTIRRILEQSSLFVEVGGGIRSMETIKAYISAGVSRVILGTAAVKNQALVAEAVAAYGDKIAVGIDVKDGYVAIKGWTEKSAYTCEEFFAKMQDMGVSTIICTDISRDGAMKGTNRLLYKELSQRFSTNIVASGGVSDIEDVKALREMGLYGAIIGKAWYTGAIDLAQAIEVAK